MNRVKKWLAYYKQGKNLFNQNSLFCGIHIPEVNMLLLNEATTALLLIVLAISELHKNIGTVILLSAWSGGILFDQ